MSLPRNQGDVCPFTPGVTQSAIDIVRCHRTGGSGASLASN
jgi:hypothetical protein